MDHSYTVRTAHKMCFSHFLHNFPLKSTDRCIWCSLLVLMGASLVVQTIYLPAMQETDLMIVVLISTTLTEVFPPVKKFYFLEFIDVPNCRLYSWCIFWEDKDKAISFFLFLISLYILPPIFLVSTCCCEKLMPHCFSFLLYVLTLHLTFQIMLS